MTYSIFIRQSIRIWTFYKNTCSNLKSIPISKESLLAFKNFDLFFWSKSSEIDYIVKLPAESTFVLNLSIGAKLVKICNKSHHYSSCQLCTDQDLYCLTLLSLMVCHLKMYEDGTMYYQSMNYSIHQNNVKFQIIHF